MSDIEPEMVANKSTVLKDNAREKWREVAGSITAINKN